MHPTFRAGLTLVEILAVVILLGLLGTALTAMPLLRGRVDADAQAAAARIRTAEQRARAGAIGGGGVFRLDQVSMFGSITWPPSAATQTWTEDLPSGFDVRVFCDRRPTDRLHYDARGRSPDAELHLLTGDREWRWQVDGLTGVWTVLPP